MINDRDLVVLEKTDADNAAPPKQHTLVVTLTPLLLTKDQVGAILGVSPRYVDMLVSRGDLPPPIKRGRLSRWRLADIEKWVASLN
jgi:predicted DNA-binding transcriptional regulator AlpA